MTLSLQTWFGSLRFRISRTGQDLFAFSFGTLDFSEGSGFSDVVWGGEWKGVMGEALSLYPNTTPILRHPISSKPIGNQCSANSLSSRLRNDPASGKEETSARA